MLIYVSLTPIRLSSVGGDVKHELLIIREQHKIAQQLVYENIPVHSIIGCLQ